MDEPNEVSRELAELREAVQGLTSRVFELEKRSASGESAERVGSSPTIPLVTTTAKSVPMQPGSSPPAPAWSAPLFPTGRLSKASTPEVPAPTVAHRDLESRIGTEWLNRIGIIALLIGVTYFLKYAFENNWIGPAGRVAIGLLAGILVVGWSEWFRGRGHAIFSYSLKAVGIGTLYLSLWAAFQVYHLVPSGAAFFAMFVVTAATGVMALSQEAQLLAAFALAGGFSTPLMVSSGENREVALFAYTALLDVAVLLLVIFRPWRRLLWMGYAGTVLLYVAWYLDYYSRAQFATTAFFAAVFFLIYAVASVLARSSRLAPDSPGRSTQQVAGASISPAVLSLVNAGVFFLQIYIMLEAIEKTANAWVALVLAAFYIVLSRIQQKQYGDPDAAQTLRLLHLGLAVGFITVAIPIYLNSHWITMGWFVEAAVLLWIATRLKLDLLTVFSVGALVLGVVRLLVWDNFEPGMVIFNARMATSTVAIAVMGLLVWHGRNRDDEAGRTMAAIGSVALNALALWALSLEIRDYFGAQIDRVNRGIAPDLHVSGDIGITRDFTYSALGMGYGGVLMVIGFLKRSAFVRWQAMVLIAITICKVFVYDVSSLDKGYRVLSFLVLGALLMGISYAYQRDWLKLAPQTGSAEPPVQS